MIALLSGRLHALQPPRIIVDVGGVGYELQVPASTVAQLPSLGAAVTLEVYTHVREDAIQLFGFASRREKILFERLLGVNGVGPKLGLAILSGLDAPELAAAIRNSDLARLAGIPGVGKKTAERLVVELREKMEPADSPMAGGAYADLVSALVNLGYATPLAERAATQATAKLPGRDFESLFTECLRAIGR